MAFERDLPCGGEALQRAAAIGDQIVEVEIANLELDVAAVGAREIQQIVDEAGESARFVEDDGERFAVLRGRAVARAGGW